MMHTPEQARDLWCPLVRIALAVQAAFHDQQPRLTQQRQRRLERLQHCNALIKIISEHGRRFFWNEESKSVARIEMDARGRLWWIDDYRGSRVYMEKIGGYENNWCGFSHGGTLRHLVQEMRDCIKTGKLINIYYIAQDCWGYLPDAKFKTREAAKILPIIKS